MLELARANQMITEEVKSVKLFLWMFYIFYFGYDSFYFILYPLINQKPIGLPEGGLGYWVYLIITSFLPVAIFLIKTGKPYLVKYFYTFGFIILDAINYVLIYIGGNDRVNEGNVVEVFIMVIVPIFLNKRFFWTVASVLVGKYAFLCVVLQSTRFLFPIVLLIVFAIVSYIFLSRFTSYVQAITSVFEVQRQNERLMVLGRMATSIGHEIRNPLSSLKGFTQLQQERDKSDVNFYPIMIQEIDRINSIVDDLMVLGRPKAPNFNFYDLNMIVDYVTSVTRQLADNYGSKIVVNPGGSLPLVECNEKQIKQALINILKNAIESMHHGGTVEVFVAGNGPNKIQVTVQDHGCGVDAEKLKKLGEPFFTTKQDGTGLGLLVTKKIIEDHHGELLFESKKEQGTKVSMILPINQK
ncbi:ATP-binding protein [Bacillus sp. T3]|uniref:ATP-binding protein n=1 Tax=Bacillus sp. T3 TaxID=467262 RepID=UPI0029823437|nr:ATP-binding protein [Bacillus sp. T3]